jgi:hypothetical protein
VTHKRVLYRSEAREKILRGASQLADAVRVTLGPKSKSLQESLIILGWVANWKPIEIFLYDWWPLARRRDLYRRLANASVELKVRQ